MEQKKNLKLKASVLEVYEYLKNLHNYSKSLKGYIRDINPEGTVAILDVPVVGKVRVVITEGERVIGKIVILESKSLGSTIKAELSEYKTGTSLDLTCELNTSGLGFLTEIAAKAAFPKATEEIGKTLIGKFGKYQED